jgi:nucleoside-diphosphate-sugar epimerase
MSDVDPNSERGYWLHRPVAVTGGASFIGSHLVDRLVKEGAHVTVVDDLSSGEIGYIARHINAGKVVFRQGDLRQTRVGDEALSGADTVFHLAAAHGGRGYIETHQSACAENVLLDAQVLGAAARCGVRKLVFASSACVYPVPLQRDVANPVALSEEMVGPPYDPDGMYGWAKLTGELALAALRREGLIEGISCRYFGVYGPRERESHALIAIIARALLGQDPIRLWGDGSQLRSWCFIRDAVEGTLRAAEEIGDGSAINIGSAAVTSVLDAARLILEIVGHEATFEFEPAMPTGPVSRCGDFTLAQERLGWSAQVPLEEGLRRTVEWYRRTSKAHHPQLDQHLETLAFERMRLPL